MAPQESEAGRPSIPPLLVPKIQTPSYLLPFDLKSIRQSSISPAPLPTGTAPCYQEAQKPSCRWPAASTPPLDQVPQMDPTSLQRQPVHPPQISQAVLHLESEVSPQEQIKEMHDSANDGYLEIAKVQFMPLRNREMLIGKLLTPESYAIYTRMQDRLKEHVGKKVKIGPNTLIEEGSFVDDGAEIGDYCRIHRNVYVGKNVKIGDNVKIQNNNSIYEGVTLEDGAFIGTNVTFINDRYPRSIHRDGTRVGSKDFILEKTRVCYGASIGAGAVIMCGVTIGKWAMVAAGSVVLKDVPEGALVAGNPAEVIKTNIRE